MGAQRATSGRDPPEVERVELLHASERTRVTRLVFPTGSVIRKEPLGPDARQRLRHEVAILERLSGVEGVAQLAHGTPPYPGSILLADVRGTALSERVTPLDMATLVDLAESLARAVAEMHRRGVVHRNIHPANIVVGDDLRMPCLIDFALATTFGAVQGGFVHPNEIVGTVPYLAPEQTGRTARPVDQRADLYTVGATLYELATGTPPFGTGDPLRIVHDHLARRPAPPTTVNPAVPAPVSAIIMHLLEKEPDDRYQGADGLTHDLALVRRGAAPARPGECDFPARPLMPSRLSGRAEEIGKLAAVFAEAMAGRCTGLLVCGAPGVGKTSLANELRPIVAGSDGWFVSGKFDQYRRDQDYDGVRQAFRALGRLLLAEPEDQVAVVRDRMLRALGPNAGLAVAVVPELAALLGVLPKLGDPMTAQARAVRTSLEILRAVASRKRPVVFFVDDLQWAGRTPLGLFDLVLGGEEQVEGVLLVAAYREGDVDAAHPLAPMIARWRRQPAGPRQLRLDNLPPEGQAALVADLLHLEPAAATKLAEMIVPATGGNPYETVELLNALRHDGVLAGGEGGWRWDRTRLRRRLARADVTGLLAACLAASPPATRDMLAAMACLAGRVELDLLEAATGLTAGEVSGRLAPAFADGLLVLETEDPQSMRFRHDRTQEAVLGDLTPRERQTIRLRTARCLANRPEFFAVAAEQYLHVADAVHAPRERRLVVRLFRRAADQARLLSNYPLVERFLTAAVRFIDPADTDQLIAVRTDRHAALYSLGRLEETNEEYQAISRLCTHPAQRTAATVAQVSSLTNQGQFSEAMRLGLDQLRQLGLTVPDRDHLEEEVDRGLDALYQWIDQTTESDDLCRPPITDRSLLGLLRLVNRIMPVAFFWDQPMMAWLTVTTLTMWARYGPDPSMLGPAGHIANLIIPRRHDYRVAHRVMRRIITVGLDRGYEPEVWHAQFLYTVSTGHWFGSLEDNVSVTRRASEGLVQGGDLQNACWTHYALLYDLLDCAPSLEIFAAELDEALAIAARTGNGYAEQMFGPCRWLTRVLRGEAVGSAADETAQLSMLADNSFIVLHLHVSRAIAAAILDRPEELARHTTAVAPLLPAFEAQYQVAVARVLRALALAARAHAAQADQRGAELAEMDESIAWLATRAADAPVNFLHLLRLIEAERAWAAGDLREAIYTFDLAQREAFTRARPWHRALIAERAARFYLAHGVRHVGHALLAEARRHYADWGATAKISQLDWAYPELRAEPGGAWPATQPPVEPTATRSVVTAGTLDLLGIVAASRALSSETTANGLRAKVVGILSAMTGATGVHLLLRDDEREGHWSVPVGDNEAVSLDGAGYRRMLPPSAIRYAERTHEPLVSTDATRDDRFTRDPYFAGLDRCSLLAIPIMIRGELRAMLLLENRMIRGAFTTERLEGIMLIAGQLAVSLDNVMIYASLERKVAERTRQLAAANRRLEQLSVTDPLTGLANRRRLDEILDAEWCRARHQATPVALAMVDIDYFKAYNDHCGHPAGDRCLQRIAACLARSTRDTDLAARYGGEEFAVVMPGADLDTAERIAERLRAAIHELAEPHPTPPGGIITVSIGVAATTPASDDDVKAFVDLADNALYQAKDGGRNRVETALPGPAAR